MGGIFFVTSRAAAAEASPGVSYAWGGRLECGLGARQARCHVPQMLRKGAELQSLSFVDRACDIGFPEPGPRAPKGSIRPSPRGP